MSRLNRKLALPAITLLFSLVLMGKGPCTPQDCVDIDGDGYGSPASAGCPYHSLDCDDTDPDVNPGVLESPDLGSACDDGLDNDCDGLIDDSDYSCLELFFGTCADDPPPGADLPDPLPAYPGTCPEIVAGMNTITSSSVAREFMLVVPEALEPHEELPVAVLWYWLAGSARDFLEKGDIQRAVNDLRFLAIIPEEKGDLFFNWPFMAYHPEYRREEEARFFDHMLACVAEQYNVNTNCVSTMGVSTGGLWVPHLAQLRARRLASFLSLSGGVGAVPVDPVNPVQPWTGAAHRMPAVVLWGGPYDWCGLSFTTTSGYLEDALISDGHFFVECIHNCFHAQPPMEVPPGETLFVGLWNFVFEHPYWLEDGESPYLVTGLPDKMPEWCGIGAGSATMRQGECDSGLFGDCF